jgi:hypothetical protein
MDLTDGLKILSAENLDIDGLGNLQRSYKVDYSEHQRHGDVWIPTIVTETNYGPDTKPYEATVIKFTDLEVNPALTSTDFTHPASFGSRIHDLRTGRTYRAGYSDPNALLGSGAKPAAAR